MGLARCSGLSQPAQHPSMWAAHVGQLHVGPHFHPCVSSLSTTESFSPLICSRLCLLSQEGSHLSTTCVFILDTIFRNSDVGNVFTQCNRFRLHLRESCYSMLASRCRHFDVKRSGVLQNLAACSSACLAVTLCTKQSTLCWNRAEYQWCRDSSRWRSKQAAGQSSNLQPICTCMLWQFHPHNILHLWDPVLSTSWSVTPENSQKSLLPP